MINLNKPVFTPLKVTDIKPQGWLLKQLEIQASGLSGNLDQFWPDIKDSQWIGGDREGWERVPYWLDGFIPLAWLLDREDMKARAKRYIDFIIEHQKEDGWICPGKDTERHQYDMWALFLILKVLVLYHDFTEDARIEDVVSKALKNLDRHIDGTTLFSWAQTRWFECLISIWWLYERTKEEWLPMLASKLHSQGFDWIGLFEQWPYKKSDGMGRWGQMSHVVNNAMALKSGALYSRLSKKENDLHSAEDMVALLDEYHGMVTGIFTGDECLSGKSPVQGTELCAVAEYMYSLEHLISLTGKAHWGDRLERITYNALPATYSPDMWTHQYDQQANQVECSRQQISIFNTNNGDANNFGLEPNYGCCTANLSQPWPKYALNCIMKAEDGIAVVVYAPEKAKLVVNNVNVEIDVQTEYPFRDEIKCRIKADQAVEFSLYLRIPAWCQDARIMIGEQSIKGVAGEFAKICRVWSNEEVVTVKLPMKPELVERPNQMYAVTRGPLVYSLAIEENWIQVNKDVPGREYPHCDYEIYPVSPWNYGLRLNKDQKDLDITFEEKGEGEMPFSPSGAPIAAKVKGSKIDWTIENGHATETPAMTWVSDEVEELMLIPYGCTNLRLTEMPLLS
ncbi:MAG: hypothetical protein K0S47_1119 [Herbinix sp.]|nr:hypothetical protein [Herbinix sp.]